MATNELRRTRRNTARSITLLASAGLVTVTLGCIALWYSWHHTGLT